MADALTASTLAFQFGPQAFDTKEMAKQVMAATQEIQNIPGVEVLQAWQGVFDAMGYGAMVSAVPLRAGQGDADHQLENTQLLVSDSQDRVTASIAKLTQAMLQLPIKTMQFPFRAMTFGMGSSG